jgi:ribose transport system substrate-binding protein
MKIWTRRSALFALTGGILLTLAGCDPPKENTGTSNNPVTPEAASTVSGGGGTGKKLTIAVIPKGLTHVFWQSVKAGADKAGAELNVDIKWDGPQKENDTAGQISVVENALTSKVDGIALAPLDKAALVSTINKVNDAKVPITIFDSAADVSEDKYVSFVATDNRQGGVMAAERMGEIVGGKGKVILVPNQANSASTMEREEGFETTIKTKFPGMTVVRSSYGESDRSKSLTVSMDALSANSDAVGIFGSCEPGAIGAMQAVKNKGLTGKIKIIGFDNTKQLEDAMIAGEVDSIIIQNPSKMGYEAVKSLVRKIKGETPDKKVDTGVVIMNKTNYENPEMADFRVK